MTYRLRMSLVVMYRRCARRAYGISSHSEEHLTAFEVHSQYSYTSVN